MNMYSKYHNLHRVPKFSAIKDMNLVMILPLFQQHSLKYTFSDKKIQCCNILCMPFQFCISSGYVRHLVEHCKCKLHLYPSLYAIWSDQGSWNTPLHCEPNKVYVKEQRFISSCSYAWLYTTGKVFFNKFKVLRI